MHETFNRMKPTASVGDCGKGQAPLRVHSANGLSIYFQRSFRLLLKSLLAAPGHVLNGQLGTLSDDAEVPVAVGDDASLGLLDDAGKNCSVWRRRLVTTWTVAHIDRVCGRVDAIKPAIRITDVQSFKLEASDSSKSCSFFLASLCPWRVANLKAK